LVRLVAQRMPLVDQIPGPGGEGELAAAVTGLPAGGALRPHRARGVQSTQESLPAPEHLSGPAGGAGPWHVGALLLAGDPVTEAENVEWPR
jgi:hypothetical protein